MVDLAASVWRDFVTDGVPASGTNKPLKSKIRQWGTWLESIITAFTSNGGLIYTSLAALNADLAHGANSSAWVIGDATVANNGIYQKLGASGAGSWSRVADLPYSYIRATNAGAGTANALVATTAIPLPANDAATLIALNIYVNNTGAATVAFNGGTPLTIKTNNGNDVQASYLVAGAIVAGYVSGSTFRLISDVASAADRAAAETAASNAAASAAAAAASASSINLPSPAANTLLIRNTGNTAYDAKPFPDTRLALTIPVYVPTRTALKALDTTKDAVANLTEAGRQGVFVWTTGDFSAQVAADTAEGIYVKATAIAATAGAWVRYPVGQVNVKWFGAKGDNSTDDRAAIVAALSMGTLIATSVYAPAGIYRVSSAITLASGSVICGDGPTLTIFRTMSATANVFTINGVSCGLFDLRIDSSVTRSAGWYIDVTSSAANFRMVDFTMAAPFEAIRIADGVGDVLFANGRIDDTVAATGRTIRVGTGTGTGPVVIVFSNVNCIASTGAKPQSHLSLFNCGDISLIGCQFIAGVYNVEITPGASQGVYSVKSTNSYYDQAGTTNVRIVPTSTGVVKRGVFVNNWISSAGTHNIDIEPASTAAVDGLTFSCNEVFGGAYGYYMTGISGNLTGINISNEMIAGSSSVGIAMDTVAKAQISNNIIGNVGGFGGVATGISTFGAMSKVQIVNNDLDGATTKINTAGATFTNGSRIEGNIGYNPVGAVAAATAGASPFTYTAGTSAETVYFKQTATNTATITQGGQQIATLANASTYYPVDLGPNESVVVTWTTTAPTYTKMVH